MHSYVCVSKSIRSGVLLSTEVLITQTCSTTLLDETDTN